MEDGTKVTAHTFDEPSRPKTVTYRANKTLTYAHDAANEDSSRNR